MRLEDRLIKYCQIDTQSDPNSTSKPSTKKQFDLAIVLEAELKELGLQGVGIDQYCNVYGYLESNLDYEVDTIAFIAHMDTAPSYSGKDVKPQIVDFTGEDIHLLNNNKVISTKEFPILKKHINKRIMVADGTTLLGADDKAGIAEIMEALTYFYHHPEVKHGRISVAFTPDEEVGGGAEFLDLERVNARFGYTVDGDEIDTIADETFNAAEAIVKINGVNIHPGSAKNKMINALNVAHEFHGILPRNNRPETTEKREGFNHLENLSGDVSSCKMLYILRNHDLGKLNRQKELFTLTQTYLNKKYGENTVELTIKDEYFNMHEVLKDFTKPTELAQKAIEKLNIKCKKESVRGGTDGSQLTFRGLPCPNIGTGGGNYHGPLEYCVIDDMYVAVEIIKNIIFENMKVGK